MKIDLTQFRTHWFEDAKGNILVRDDDCWDAPENAEFYYSAFPCTFDEKLSHYGYHPDGIYKLLIKIPMMKSKVQKRIGKTFRHVATFSTTYGCKLSQDCIIGMVTSGDYTLAQAIWASAKACERCGNALIYKYTNGSDGYSEDSEEYAKETTRCLFCNGINSPDATKPEYANEQDGGAE